MTGSSESSRRRSSVSRITNAVSSFLAGNTSHGRTVINTLIRSKDQQPESSLFSQVRGGLKPLKNNDSFSEKVKKPV
jgi:hypothetical protein